MKIKKNKRKSSGREKEQLWITGGLEGEGTEVTKPWTAMVRLHVGDRAGGERLWS